MLQSMKSTPNGNAIKHIKYEDINAICDYLSTDKNTLKSLAEKVSPKKIIYDKGYNGERLFFCPNCNKSMPKSSFLINIDILIAHTVDNRLIGVNGSVIKKITKVIQISKLVIFNDILRRCGKEQEKIANEKMYENVKETKLEHKTFDSFFELEEFIDKNNISAANIINIQFSQNTNIGYYDLHYFK